MTKVAEKIVVTALEFLDTRNINDSFDYTEPLYQTKLKEFGWPLSFAAQSIVCELVWKIALRGGGMVEFRQVDRLFSPSPISTHANFRGIEKGSGGFTTGNVPEPGAIAIWKHGNTWKGEMGIVISVSEDKKEFEQAQGKCLTGNTKFLTLERKKKRADNPWKNDRLNLIGFIYPINREIT